MFSDKQRAILLKRNTTHGLSRGPDGKIIRLYNIWSRMKQRCHDLNSSDFAFYGGRGIQVCPEWRSDFKSFHDWAHANGYDDSMSIERADVNGNYEPGNCSWISMKEQSRNKRNNHLIAYGGETKTLAEWAEILGIQSSLLRYRLKHWDTDRIFAERMSAK